MAPTPDAIAYSYVNIGLELGLGVSDGIAYEYINVGVKPDPNFIGKLMKLAGPRTHAIAYEYIDVTV